MNISKQKGRKKEKEREIKMGLIQKYKS